MDMDTNIKPTEEQEKLEKIFTKKSEVVSISAHQIRTSLSALKWIIKMFLDGDLGKLTAEQENLLKKAYESNDRAISIVSELLLANKTEDIAEEKYTKTEFGMEELIDSVMFDFSGEAHTKGVETIFLKPESRIPDIYADKEKMRVVLQNLLENSIKYSDMHGKVFITLVRKDDAVQVSIKDTGVGISEEGKEKMFEKFYRDSEARKKEIVGSGIGLYTIKKIIEGHNGKVWFESQKGQGTTFFFTIPVSG